MKNIAVVLSGCGFKDGSEITEAVSTLVGISAIPGTQTFCFAPDLIFNSVDHTQGSETDTRNAIRESARISRGAIQPLKELKPTDFDGVIFPGGFGAALNLCDWAKKGANCQVLPDVVRIITAFYEQSKPIGALCIAPVLLAKILGHKEITITVGSDPATIQEIEKTGAIHEECLVTDYITDRSHKIITTPAYMYNEASPHEVFKGIQGLVNELLEMA